MPKKNVEPYEKVHQSRKDLLFNNFLGGIAWGVGSTIGLAIVLALLGFVAKEINVIPFVGNFVTHVMQYVNTHK